MTDKLIYILSYDDYSHRIAQQTFHNKEWASVFKINTTIYLENIMYDSILLSLKDSWIDLNFIGTMSWKANQKIEIPDLDSEFSKQKIRDIDPDIIAFFHTGEDLLDQATKHHGKNFEYLWITLLTRMGYSKSEAKDKNIKSFFANYWISKPNFMIDYINFYHKAIKILLESKDLYDISWSDSGHVSHPSKEHLISIFNKPYFPLFLFILERLPCFYFRNHKILLY